MTALDPIVIVGGGLAGAKAAESLRGWGFDGRVVLVTEEPVRPYQRPPLSKSYLRGRSGFEDAAVHPEAWYADHRVELATSTRAVALDPAARRVELSTGASMSYHRLLLATGARPRRLEVPGADLDGVFHLRGVADADAIRAAARPGRRAVVVGAGWVGTEVAASLCRTGVEVVLVLRSEAPFARTLGPEIGRVVAGLHAEHGVELHPNVTVRALHGPGVVERVELSDGSSIEAELVVVGLGVLPATELAGSAGLQIGDGVWVDAALRTSAPEVFAAGDIANVDHPVLGSRVRSEHWWSALTQPSVAAANMLGRSAAYDWIPTFTSKQYDLMIEHTGWAPVWDSVVFRGDPASRCFVAFWLAEGRVRAGMTAGIAGQQRHIRALVAAGARVPAETLADRDTDLAALAEVAITHEEEPAMDHQHPEINEGLREWYESCPCCMSQALPEVKQALDEERAAASAGSTGEHG